MAKLCMKEIRFHNFKSVTICILILCFIGLTGSVHADDMRQTITSLFKAGGYDQAEQICNTLISQNPGSDAAVEAMGGLVEVYVRSAKLDKTKQAYNQLVTEFPLDGAKREAVAAAVHNIAESYRATKNYSKAIQLHRDVINHTSDTNLKFKSWSFIVLSHYLKHDNESGQSELNSLIADFPNHNDNNMDRIIHYVGKHFNWANREYLAVKVHEYNADRFCQASIKDKKFAYWSMSEALACYAEREDVTKMKELTSRWLAQSPDPTSKSAIDNMAASRYQAIDLDGCIALHEHNAENYPGQETALMSQAFLIRHYIGKGQYGKADSHISEMRDIYKDNDILPVKLYEIVKTYMIANQNVKVQQLCSELSTDFASHKNGYLFGICDSIFKFTQGDVDGANLSLQTLRSKVSADAYDGVVSYRIYEIARGYNWAGNTDAGLDIHQYNIDSFPSHSPVFSRLEVARIQIKQGDWACVMQSADGMINNCSGNERLGEAVFVIGEKCFEAARDYEQKGQASQSRLYYQKTIEVCDKLLKRIPPDRALPYAWYFKAFSYWCLEDYSKAVEGFEVIVDQWPDFEFASVSQSLIASGYFKLYENREMSKEQAYLKFHQAYNAVSERYPDSTSLPSLQIYLDSLEQNN